MCPCVELIPVRFVCIPRTESHTRGSSPGTVRDTPSAALPPPLYCSPSPTEQNTDESNTTTFINETMKHNLNRPHLFLFIKIRRNACILYVMIQTLTSINNQQTAT